MEATPNIRMIDVGDKAVTYRQAAAKGRISMKKETLQLVKKAELPKGDAIATAPSSVPFFPQTVLDTSPLEGLSCRSA